MFTYDVTSQRNVNIGIKTNMELITLILQGFQVKRTKILYFLNKIIVLIYLFILLLLLISIYTIAYQNKTVPDQQLLSNVFHITQL